MFENNPLWSVSFMNQYCNTFCADRVDSTLCHHLLLFHLDYPSNGHHPKAWKLLEDVHTSQ